VRWPCRRLGAGLAAVAFALGAAGCTSNGVEISIGVPSGSPAATPDSSPGSEGLRVKPVRTGQATSTGAMKELCIAPEPVSTSDGQPPDDTSPFIAEVERQVEAVRGRDYLEPVVAEPVTSERIADELTNAFDDTYPKAFYDRRTVAWQTIGVIPDDVTIREALLAFQTGQVVGFYNPVDGELVYLSDDDQLDLIERYTLAHELTHAMDDQHFDLTRMDEITARCKDEAFQAALGAVEGSAQFFATRVVLEFPDPGAGLGDAGGSGLPDGVPPFIIELQLWPYTAGQAFVTALAERGGLEAIDGALRTFPVTTEQIMHPERYPDDLPTPIDIRDLAKRLGADWGDLDVMVVGEEWLRAMLALHLDEGEADVAAAGWDGGVYRAWTDGTDAAVLMSTVWDTAEDATAFAQAMGAWLESSGERGVATDTEDRRVMVCFATSDAVLSVLRAES
jgi:hypothetical protein